MAPDPLNVLVYGSLEAGSCDVFRFGMYQPHLARLGVTMRPWTQLRVDFAPGFEGRPEDALAGGAFEIDRTDLDWADVIVFKRFYHTVPACRICDKASRSKAEIVDHARRTGHGVRGAEDLLLRPLWKRIGDDPSFLGHAAVVYETDDDVLATPEWTGHAAMARLEADLVRSMLRRADLVTVSTPPLAKMARRFNQAVRLIRNAIEPSWYPPRPRSASRDGQPRLLFYGVPVRLRDYAVCRDAVDELAGSGAARRVWLGSEDPAVRAVVDEARPYVRPVSAFAAELAKAHPDIGLAPLVDEPFNRARSELHWLEYSMAGAATLASGTMGGGPYEAIRDGMDGLLARNKGEWIEGLRRLSASPALRQELAGRARERVLAEYAAADRAAEWAAAYRWAAEHAGRGSAGRKSVGQTAVE